MKNIRVGGILAASIIIAAVLLTAKGMIFYGKALREEKKIDKSIKSIEVKQVGEESPKEVGRKDIRQDDNAAGREGVLNASKEDEIKELINKLADIDINASQEAADKLVNLGKQAAPCLIKVLPNASIGLKGQAAFLLGRIGDKEAVPVLIETAEDDNSYIRRNAVEALGKIKDPRALPVLTNALFDGAASVRQRAAWALGEIQAHESVSMLIKRLGEEKDQGVKVSIVRSLGELKDPAATSALLKQLIPNTYGPYTNEILRSLGEIGDIKALAEIEEYVNALKQIMPTEEELIFEWQQTIRIAEESVKKIQETL